MSKYLVKIAIFSMLNKVIQAFQKGQTYINFRKNAIYTIKISYSRFNTAIINLLLLIIFTTKF